VEEKACPAEEKDVRAEGGVLTPHNGLF